MEVKNTIRSFGEIWLTLFEKYRKRRTGPVFCDRGVGIAYAGSILGGSGKYLVVLGYYWVVLITTWWYWVVIGW